MEKNLKMMIGGVVALVVVVGLSYSVLGLKGKKPATVASVAKVNGVDLPKSAYDSQLATAVASSKSQGVNTDDPAKLAEIKQQVLDAMINNEIVMQAIAKTGTKATPEQVEAQYQVVLGQVGGADKLKEQLATAGITDEQLRQNITTQLTVQAYLLASIASTPVSVTDAEISEFYTNYSKTQTNPPPLKDLKEQIRQQITLNKQQVLVNAYITQLRQQAKVETSI